MANSLIRGIDNIGICVADLARSVQFYQQLGFEVLFESDRGVTVALGPAKLFLFPAQPGDERTVGRYLGLSGNPPGIDHISFLVDDVDALHASLTADGVDAGPQPADQDWGARAFGLIDPDGNNLYFLRWLLPDASRPALSPHPTAEVNALPHVGMQSYDERAAAGYVLCIRKEVLAMFANRQTPPGVAL